MTATTKTQTDAQRIRRAFKALNAEGIDTKFGEVDFSTRANRRYVYGASTMVSINNGKNSLDAEGNIPDNTDNWGSFSLSVTGDSIEDHNKVVDALRAEGLFPSWEGETKYAIIVRSHKLPEYDNQRFDKGYQKGRTGAATPHIRRKMMSDGWETLEPMETNGYISGALDRIKANDTVLFDSVSGTVEVVQQTLDQQAAFRAVLPLVSAL